MRASALALFATFFMACGGDEPPSMVEPAFVANDPVLTPCPPGWTEDGVGRALRCEPFVEGEPPACGRAEFSVPGGECELVGSPCPADGFPAALPEGATVFFVDGLSAAGGDGTRAMPFSSLAAALEAAAGADGEVAIALAAGELDEMVEITRPLTLVGACAEETTLRGTADGLSLATVLVSTPGVALRDLTIAGDLPGVVARASDGELRLESVIVDGASGFGVYAAGAMTLSISHSLVRGVGPDEGIIESLALDPGETTGGLGVMGAAGATVRISRTAFEGHGVGAVADGIENDDGVRIELSDVLVVDTPSGIGCTTCSLLVERSAIVGATQGNLGIFGGDAVLRDTVLRGLGDARGPGVAAIGSRLLTERVVLEALEGTGFAAVFGAEVTLTDTVVDDVTGTAEQELGGRGLVAALSTVSGERLVFVDATEVGVAAFSRGTALSFVDLRVEGTRPLVDLAVGLGSYQGASVDVTRFEIAGNEVCGVQIAMEAEIDLREGTVSGSPIGANVQIDDYDLARISADVVYQDNGINLDSSTIAVPEATLPMF